MFLLENIKEFEDGYKIEQVNCLEKPLVIILNNYNEIYYHCFLAFHKLLQSYSINCYNKNFNDNITMHRARIILNKEFDIGLNCKKGITDINWFINSQLKNNNPVIVPVDLYELFYSEHYKKNHWIHSFLIYKSDNEKKIYYIIDATQQFDNIYHKFVIPFDMLEKMYLSFNECIYSEGIYYIESDTVNLNPDVKYYIGIFFSYFRNALSKDICREIEILNKLTINEISKNKATRSLLKINNYKEVFYNEIEWMINKFKIDKNLIKKYNELKVKLLNQWKKISNKLTYYIYKSEIYNIKSLLEPVLNSEQDMFNFFYELSNSISYGNCVNNDVEQSYVFDNNKDKIISTVGNDNFIFNFNTNKIYDNWIQDCAPKIIYSVNDIRGKVLNSNVKLNLMDCDVGANYMAGFYMKTEKNSKYLCGVNSGVCISMDQSGINQAIFTVEKCSSNLNMNIRIINDEICFKCFDTTNNEMITIQKIKLDSVVCEFGVSCKTWNTYIPLKMVFSDFNVLIN